MKRPSLHIYFTDKTSERLRNFVRKRFGSHRALSMTVQQAVQEYLDREERGQLNEHKNK